MSDFEIIVLPAEPTDAKKQLQAWLGSHPDVQRRLGDEDLILDEVLGEGGQWRHQYRIRRSCVGSRIFDNQVGRVGSERE
jgi:hypothetical protein